MYTDRELESEMYGDQDSTFMWKAKASYPPSPDRHRANLGQPLKHLSGEPDPLALWVLFSRVHGKNRAKLAIRFFGAGQRGPHPKWQRSSRKLK